MSIQEAEYWLKSVVSGQPIHRDELGEENSSSGTLRGISPRTLQLAPQLQNQLAQELQNAPKFDGPQISVPGMSPGGNTTSGPRTPGLNNRSPKPPTNGGTKDD